jgi:hypothetical protein
MRSPQDPDQTYGHGPVESPFAHVQAAVPAPPMGFKSKRFIWGGIIALILVVVVIWGVVFNRLNNPYRTLPPFPVDKYLESYQSLEGTHFRGEMRVEADLGWKDGVGRLMLFTMSDDTRPVAVFIPVDVAKNIYFTKDQVYLAELEVKEGGLIHAYSISKN